MYDASYRCDLFICPCWLSLCWQPSMMVSAYHDLLHADKAALHVQLMIMEINPRVSHSFVLVYNAPALTRMTFCCAADDH